MEKNKILNADILDIIFDGKNKLYGAYELRSTYNNRLAKATVLTIALVVLVFFGTVLSSMAGKNKADTFEVQDIGLTKVAETPLPPPPPVIKVPPPVQPNQQIFIQPIIVKDDLVPEAEKIEDLHDNALISNKTIVSDNKDLIIQAPVDVVGSEVVEAPKTHDEDKVYLSVQKEAEFPGGQQAWARYLQKNLDPNAPVENGAPAGTYQVIVKFIVSKDGTISDVNAVTKLGFGMEEEAIKIIKRGPKWTPALQNDRNVNAYRSQPITFIVPEQ